MSTAKKHASNIVEATGRASGLKQEPTQHDLAEKALEMKKRVADQSETYRQFDQRPIPEDTTHKPGALGEKLHCLHRFRLPWSIVGAPKSHAMNCEWILLNPSSAWQKRLPVSAFRARGGAILCQGGSSRTNEVS